MQKVMERLESLFKEEIWGRIDVKDIGVSKFKILDDLFNSIVADNVLNEADEACKKHLDEYPNSMTSAYLIGILGYHNNKIEDTVQLRKLIDRFIDNHKWAVVELIAEKILEYGESSVALRALALSLERLGRQKEAIPVLDSLLKIDRFDAEVAKKLAFAIIDDDPDKSIYYMKLSIEGFIKNKDFDEVSALWNKLVSVSWEDIAFFERIERMLVDAKQQDLAASLLKALLVKYRDEENPDQSIELLKKVLMYKPDDTNARRDLIKMYNVKYGKHSQYEQFLRLSRLTYFKAPVKFAIMDFEKNIVFDIGNYVYHTTWGVGNIVEISSESICVNFKDKPGHKMSVQMALQSLTPINKDHIYIMKYEDPDTLKNIFDEDFMQFFEMLIKSYNGKIELADIKRELIPDFVEEKNWSKWWSKARTKIKKDPIFGVSDKKKDLIYMRDKPLTLADELLDIFIKTDSFTNRLNASIEFINNVEKDEGTSVVQYFIDYFSNEAKGESNTRLVLSYFILKDLAGFLEPNKVKLDFIHNKVISFLKESDELPIISRKINSYDYKKDFVSLIKETREDWSELFIQLLFETPVRIHKYIANIMIRSHSYKEINKFIDMAITGAKQYPEIYIWVAKNLFTKTWDYSWLDLSMESVTITYFRLLNELKKIEIEGNRLKNMSLDVLFDNESALLKDIVNNFNKAYVGKLYDLFCNVPFIEESQADKFLNIIKSKFSDFQVNSDRAEDSLSYTEEKLLVSQEGYEKKKAELDKLVSVDLANISKELAKVSELTGDLRENVEYTALMERQATLELNISRLEEEMKKATVFNNAEINTDAVNIGTKVYFEDLLSGGNDEYTILGPWDADFENKILSYRSPIAKVFLGKKVGDAVELKMNDEERKFKVKSVVKYNQ